MIVVGGSVSRLLGPVLLSYTMVDDGLVTTSLRTKPRFIAVKSHKQGPWRTDSALFSPIGGADTVRQQT